MNNSKSTLTIVSLILLIFSGCAHQQATSRVNEYKELLDPLVGVANKDDILLKFGIPQRKSKTEKLEVWEYKKSFGTRGNAQAFSNPYAYNTTAYGQSHEVYDEVILFFDESDLLYSWKAYAQR
jgi:hypothetical protein